MKAIETSMLTARTTAMAIATEKATEFAKSKAIEWRR